MRQSAKNIIGAYGLGSLIAVLIFQRDTNHFTNWNLCVQSIFYCLVVFDALRTAVTRFLLPVVFANTLAVFVGSYAILYSGSTLYHDYVHEYGETEVHAGNIGLHLIPFLIVAAYARVFRVEIKEKIVHFARRPIQRFDYVVCVVGSTLIMPLGYRLFYNPVVEYGSEHDNVWISWILLSAYIVALSFWFWFIDLFPTYQAKD